VEVGSKRKGQKNVRTLAQKVVGMYDCSLSVKSRTVTVILR